ncbi:MAG: putative colanic acid biosynthesis acetyltransferase [Candidatus Marinimicrobia bacterium]|nr:putative colanic acid biosynthesis acetyltransferase [Candidatus Neomarinimicrobiota bacterium]
MYQNLKTFKIPNRFRSKSKFVVQFWWIIQDTLFRWSPQFMYGWRRFLLKLFGAKIGKNVFVRPSAKILYPWNLIVGDWSWIGDEVTLYNMAKINIGKNCVISQNSYLCTGSHDYTKSTFDIYAKPITIKDEVWVASDVFIAPSVTIGYGSVVGIRSTVNNDLPPQMICFGNPAKPIKPR